MPSYASAYQSNEDISSSTQSLDSRHPQSHLHKPRKFDNDHLDGAEMVQHRRDRAEEYHNH